MDEASFSLLRLDKEEDARHTGGSCAVPEPLEVSHKKAPARNRELLSYVHGGSWR